MNNLKLYRAIRGGVWQQSLGFKCWKNMSWILEINPNYDFNRFDNIRVENYRNMTLWQRIKAGCE